MVAMLVILLKIAFWAILILSGLIAAYLLIVVCIIMGGVCYTVALNFFGELLIKRRMRLAGRFLTWRDALERIEDSKGTVILESPIVGWNVTRAWWTPDNVTARAPIPPPDPTEYNLEILLHHPFFRWCHKQYADLDHGSAYLVAVYNGERRVKHMLTRHPKLTKIDLWSGVLSMPDSLIGPPISEAD